jgi:hypothetical protein
MTVGATHATLATFRMDLSREEEQTRGLNEMVIPGVRQFPGFLTGTWALDREGATSHVMITYQTLDAAEQMAANVRDNAENQRHAGLELVDVKVLEVVAVA